MVDNILMSGALAIGVQGVALLIVKSWFKGVNQKLERLNGFKDRFLADYVTMESLNMHEARCGEKFSDLFKRLHEVETKKLGG